MPIVVSIQTGEIISKPDYTQADYNRAWDAIARAWAKKHRAELCQGLGVERIKQDGKMAKNRNRAAYSSPD